MFSNSKEIRTEEQFYSETGKIVSKTKENEFGDKITKSKNLDYDEISFKD